MLPLQPSKPTTLHASNDVTASGPGRRADSHAAVAVLALLRAYKLAISPYLTGCCRFYPSCSNYMAEAVGIHGVVRGVWLGLHRIGRCNPFGGHGVDPVPHK